MLGSYVQRGDCLHSEISFCGPPTIPLGTHQKCQCIFFANNHTIHHNHSILCLTTDITIRSVQRQHSFVIRISNLFIHFCVIHKSIDFILKQRHKIDTGKKMPRTLASSMEMVVQKRSSRAKKPAVRSKDFVTELDEDDELQLERKRATVKQTRKKHSR